MVELTVGGFSSDDLGSFDGSGKRGDFLRGVVRIWDLSCFGSGGSVVCWVGFEEVEGGEGVEGCSESKGFANGGGLGSGFEGRDKEGGEETSVGGESLVSRGDRDDFLLEGDGGSEGFGFGSGGRSGEGG